MNEMKEEIELNGIKYVSKSMLKKNVNTKAKPKKGMEFCIIRTYSAGVFAGWINRKFTGKESTIFDSRRIWYWKGASSLSQMANDGVKTPDACKFAQIVPESDLKEIIEIIPCTEKAKEIILNVKVWEND